MPTFNEIISRMNAEEFDIEQLPQITAELQQVWGDFETGSTAALTQIRGEKANSDMEIQRLQSELWKMHVALGSENLDQENEKENNSFDPIKNINEMIGKKGV